MFFLIIYSASAKYIMTTSLPIIEKEMSGGGGRRERERE